MSAFGIRPPPPAVTYLDTVLPRILLNGETMSADLTNAVTDSTMRGTIEGASTIELEFADPDRAIVRSDLLSHQAVLSVPGPDGMVQYALVQIKKRASLVRLTFEDAIVTILRHQDEPRKVEPGTVSRIGFAKMLFSELPFEVPFVFPDKIVHPLSTVELARGKFTTPTTPAAAVDTSAIDDGSGDGTDDGSGDTGGDIAGDASTTGGDVRDTGTLTYSEVAVIAYRAGFRGANLRIAVAVAFAESSFRTDAHKVVSNGDSRGLWQINVLAHPQFDADSMYSAAANAAAAFEVSGGGENWGPWTAFTSGAYHRYEDLADTAATKAEASGGALPSNPFGERTSGTKTVAFADREDTWTCLQRIFGEIKWRLWAWQGTIYTAPDNLLVEVDPAGILREHSGPVDDIDFEFDEGKPIAKVELDVFLPRFEFWPGDAVEIADLGHASRKWLLLDVERTLTSPKGKVTLVTPTAPLPEPPPEPAPGTAAGTSSGNQQTTGTADAETFVQFCLSKEGGPYVWGGNGPDGYDCSGLVKAGVEACGIGGFPRVSEGQIDACEQISVAEAAATRGAVLWHFGHIAVSLGNGDQTIEAMGHAYGILKGKVDSRFKKGGLIPGLRYGYRGPKSGISGIG